MQVFLHITHLGSESYYYIHEEIYQPKLSKIRKFGWFSGLLMYVLFTVSDKK